MRDGHHPFCPTAPQPTGHNDPAPKSPAEPSHFLRKVDNVLGAVCVRLLGTGHGTGGTRTNPHQNLNDARDPSGVSSQRNPGLGRFDGRKCRCLFQRPRQAALLALGPGPSRDGGSMSGTARLSALVYLRQRRGQPVIHYPYGTWKE